MGQKANLITLRKDQLFFTNLSNFNTKFFLFGLSLLKHFKNLLLLKNVLLIKENLNYISNKIYFEGSLFYRTNKIKIYKRRLKRLKICSIKSEKNILNLFLKFNQHFKTNLVFTKFTLLNQRINKKLLKFLYRNFKKFSSSIFQRRFGLFIDFLKLTTLFFYSKIDLKTLLYIISDIFKNLRKKSHSRFLSFIKKFFDLLIFKCRKFNKQSYIKGIKFVIKGRFKGKTMSSTTRVESGLVPIQSFSKKVEYAQVHTFTPKFGVFGFKAWVFKK